MIGLIKDIKTGDKLDYSAYIAITFSGEAYIISYNGDNRDLFCHVGELFSQGLLPPHFVGAGLYYCTDFETVNHIVDWETQIVNSYSIKCSWELKK
jgi:hypothetical protein